MNGSIETQVMAVAIGARMRTLRDEAGLTVAEVARRLGSHGSVVSRMEMGHHLQDLEGVVAFALVVRCAPIDILGVLDGVQTMFRGPDAT